MLIYGRNPVFEALRNGTVTELLVARGVEPKLVRELEASGVPIRWQARIELDQLVGTTQHQGVVAEVAELEWAQPEDVLDNAAARGEQPLIVLLDGVTDPRNFGAIIRSAEVLGAHGVIVEERRSAPLSPVVAKTAAGATAYLPVAQVKNLPRFIDQLKEQGIWVYGAAGEARRTAAQLDYDRPLALVIGSEGEGLRRLVREKCDELVAIPVRGRVSSLNASVAASLLIYQAVMSRPR
ncbi:23S rRNA (guanosine2251-2'-O)-methyltransferase [Deinobacterium chartae]|uniref:23S rRNA (Guanosine2251-2'-O)-methyltransferase n=1 Tax=Deinobacterium chartae TaxID=521158 RepID=A0A841I5G0_9DEIO|nr:23S rRNA (guanosine(2251)-2'-O)-methyltransferase RlmB [Deinobacterium chartae]MBB6099115.1 23S rRNA (guanosine2251-2'-O)-methyltransferase [Deinobacterium chartae]